MARTKEFDPDKVMVEAMEAFWDRGYNATSVNDLLEEMGLNRGSLYGTFGDKKQLFLAALKKYDERHGPMLLEILNRPGSARQNLRDWVRSKAGRCHGQEGRRGCMAVKAAMELVPHDKDVADWLQQFNQRHEQTVADVIKRGQEAGEINRKLKPRAAARYLLSSMGGLTILGIMSPSEKDVDEVVELILKVLD